MADYNELWFSDAEVYKYDSIWVFKNKRTKEIVWFHNDHSGVQEFLNARPSLRLVGYNFRDYDQYILKGTLLGYSNAKLKELNDTIIHGDLQDVWDYLGSETWDVTPPPIIDLYHDIVPPKSLKEIEGNMGRAVKETTVPFDIDRPLTPDEVKRTIQYCIDDVEATEALYYERLTYLSTKKQVCDLHGLDEAEMMKNTNARVVSEALGARKCNPLETFGKEYYMSRFPEGIVDFDKLPAAVKDFVSSAHTYSGWRDKMAPILFDLYGTPTVMGIGGLHASTGVIHQHTLRSGPRKGVIENRYVAQPKYFKSGKGRSVVIQDIGSFYPSMMIIFHLFSRGLSEAGVELFIEMYHTRMEAKAHIREAEAAHDHAKATYWRKIADAAKLVLNTVYGCLKNQYNKLYDPFMGLCVCLTGQLLIIDLMRRIQEEVDDVEIVQLNTDGWVLDLPDDQMENLTQVIEGWKELTGFSVDTDMISQLWQRDVNNYVLEFDTGKIKAKGGTVKNWNGGDFTSNSMTIIDKALVEYMIHSISIEETIYGCDDLERYQIIVKAGSKYVGCAKRKEVEHKSWETYPLIGKVHRIYASRSGFEFVKIGENGKENKISDTPVHAVEDFELTHIAQLDKEWYIEMAYKKLGAFTSEKDRRKVA